MFAAELRRLHDGGAHLVRGYDNLAIYAEHTFDGLTANAAKQLSRQGGVLLTLEHHGRISLDQPTLPVATTALRALSVVHNTFGENTMLTVYDRAIELWPGRAIVEQTVRTATREPDVPGATPKPPAAAIDAPEPSEADPEDVDDELPTKRSPSSSTGSTSSAATSTTSASTSTIQSSRRELRNIEEEVEQVRAALAAADGRAITPTPADSPLSSLPTTPAPQHSIQPVTPARTQMRSCE